MYQPDSFDHAFLAHRSAQFRSQVAQRLSGALTEEEFRPLRLMNGLYLQLHAYMLRVAIPYGTLSARQMRALADLAERWDRGYGHFTTRQNIQFNWIALSQTPDIMDHLATVGLHAVQTSGNTIRNVTTDPFAGAAADEIEDPRPIAELIRQWSTDHPEFQFLPRKFKIAVSASPADRAITRAHDIGLRLVRNDAGETGIEISIGGGLGRTPMLGQVLVPFTAKADLIAWLEAILHVYNLLGRRDNKYKARLKITVNEIGIDDFRTKAEARFEQIRATHHGAGLGLLARIEHLFTPPPAPEKPLEACEAALASDPRFARWARSNTAPHKRADHAIVTISLKSPGAVPGDASAGQMRLLADLAERHSHGELRVTQSQNIVLPNVHRADLPALHAALAGAGLAAANAGLASDITACPGLDYCALATARSIPVAQEIARRVEALKIEHEIGPLSIKISGCINACAHHHLGDIGILGLDRAGVENYQITLGGQAEAPARLGERAGPGFPADEITDAVERLLRGYLALRTDAEESFAACYRRLGPAPFRSLLYPDAERGKHPRHAA